MTTQRKQWVSWEELNALFPDLSAWSSIDFQQVGGLTPGSIPFADADGMLTEDNANLFWDETNARLGIGTAAPAADCALHIEFPAVAVVISRLSAKERPWRQWESMDNTWGLAIGIHDTTDGKIHFNYDDPIGTRDTSMIVFDGPNKRVGIREEAPSYGLDVGGSTRIQSSLLVTGVVNFDITLDVTGDTTLSKLFVTGNAEDGLNLTATSSQIRFTGGAGEKGINYKDTGGDQRYAMMFPDGSDVVHVLNRAANGTVEIHANTAVAGGAGDVKVAEFQDSIINFFVDLDITGTLDDDERGLSSIFTLSENPAKSDGIALYTEGHIGAITTDGPTYGAGIWLNIDAGATLGADVRALDIGIYEAGADCDGGNAYGLAIHMEFDDTDPPAAIYPFRLNTNETAGHATPDALIFAANKSALAVTEGDFPYNNYLKIVVQDGTVYKIPLITEGAAEFIALHSSAELRFYDNGNYVGFEAPALGADQIWVLPSADADAANKCLQSDHAGNLGWSQALGATDSPTFAGVTITGVSTFADATIGDDVRGLSSIFTLSADPAKSDGIAFYSEGHIGAITTDGSTYGAGIWLNIDAGATLGADVRALDIGIYEAGADCSGGNAYGLAIHMEFDDTNPPSDIYPFRINCNDTPGHATATALIFAPNEKAIGLITGNPGVADDAYLKIVMQNGDIYRIPLVKE